MVNSMLINSGIPENLWGEALLTACYILNRIPFKQNNFTPYEIQKKRKPNLSYFKLWGCLAKVKIPEVKRKKIRPKTIDTIFIGYTLNNNADRFSSNTNQFLIIKSEISDISNNTIIEAKDAIYFENIFSFKSRIETNIRNSEPSTSSNQIIPRVEEEDLIEPRRSKRTRTEKSLKIFMHF